MLSLLVLILVLFLRAIPAQDLNALANKLATATTANDRFDILNEDAANFVFDFANPKGTQGVTTGPDGRTVAANVKTFPLLTESQVGLTLGFLGPCGLNTPHTHPRGAEFNLAINGTLVTGVFNENGAKFVMTEIKPLQATLFPQGAIHFEQNTGCEPAFFVAAFSSNDPGVSDLGKNFLESIPVDFLSAVIGREVEEFPGLLDSIPDNVAFGTTECLRRCGLNSTRPITSQLESSNRDNPWDEKTNAIPQRLNRLVTAPVVDKGPGEARLLVAQSALEGTSQSSENDSSIITALYLVIGLQAALIFLILAGAAFFCFLRRRTQTFKRGEKAATIWARPFGQTQGSSFERVAGDDSDYKDPWNRDAPVAGPLCAKLGWRPS